MNNKFFPSNFLFVIIIIIGTILSLSSSHWLTIWIGLELNLIGFLPLINIKGKILEAEASMKYFIIQSIRSRVLIISSVIIYNSRLSWYSMFTDNITSNLIILSLILKLGGAPLHFWMPSITKQITWGILFIMLTWQKLAPLFILSLINSNQLTLLLISVASTIIGRIIALNQTNLQLIITYSSISHLGWMLSTISINRSLRIIYFINYIIISIPLINMLSTRLGRHLFSLAHKSKVNNLIAVSLVLSLGGLPPLLGFISKLIILLSLAQMKIVMLRLMIFCGTLIRLYFYLNMSLILMIKSYKTFDIAKPTRIYNPIISFNILSRFIIYPLIIIFIKYAMTILYKS